MCVVLHAFRITSQARRLLHKAADVFVGRRISLLADIRRRVCGMATKSIIESLRSEHRLLTSRQIATMLSVNLDTLYDWCKQGAVPYMRIGRNFKFDPAEIANWLEKREVK